MNKHYRREVKITIKCSNQVLPTAMQQLNGVVNIDMCGPQVALGNQQMQQLPMVQQVKPVELVPTLNVPRDIAQLPDGRRIPRG